METTWKRRELLDLLTASLAGVAVTELAGATAAASAATDGDQPALAGDLFGEHIAMLVYPGMTLLDLVGPHTCFSALGMTTHLVWKTLEPVTTESGIVIMPTTTFELCPLDLDIFFIPGSTLGTAPLIRDPEVLELVRSRGERAKLVTSVCTGSLLLGAAGLLRGYKATSHWFTRELLPEVEAIRVDARFVEDRNRITGAGVTSGIDFGLRLVDRLRGRDIAETTQLLLEYAPEPPFNAGEPTTAPALAVDTIRTLFGLALEDTRLAMREAATEF
ncbi:MAG: DJ-1/PfpI family protein [Polyangiales bacterium]